MAALIFTILTFIVKITDLYFGNFRFAVSQLCVSDLFLLCGPFNESIDISCENHFFLVHGSIYTYLNATIAQTTLDILVSNKYQGTLKLFS